MFKNVVFAVACSLTLLLGGCEEEGGGTAGATWEPLACDVEETLTSTRTEEIRGTLRATETTYTSFVTVVDADPSEVLVRVSKDLPDPCAGIEFCTVDVDTRVVPDGYYDYYAPGQPAIVGTVDGQTRVLCSHTTSLTIRILDENHDVIEVHTPEPFTVIVAEGGDVLVSH